MTVPTRSMSFAATVLVCVVFACPTETHTQGQRTAAEKTPERSKASSHRKAGREGRVSDTAGDRVSRREPTQPPPPPPEGSTARIAPVPKSPSHFAGSPIAKPEYTMAVISNLEELGYGGAVAGELAASVTAFQRNESLPVVGVAGPLTRRTLHSALERAATLKRLNARPEVQTLILESHHLRPRPARYVLHGVRGLLYRGDDAAALTEHVRAELAKVPASFYVDLSSYPADRVEPLIATLRVADAVSASPRRLRFARSRESLEALRPGIRIQRVAEIRETNGRFESAIDFTFDSPAPRTRQPLGLTAWTATKELLSEFLRILLGLFDHGGAPGVFDGSLAEAVARAKRELAQREGLSASELDARVRIGFAGLDIGQRSAASDVVWSE